MKKILMLIMLSILVLAACKAPEPIIVEKPAEVICPDKYMRIGTICCLDANQNNICDSDELMPIEEEEPLQEVSMPKQVFQKALTFAENGYSFSIGDEQYFIKNNKVKLLLSDYVKLGYDYEKSRLNMVDTVYMDINTKYAFGVCSGRYFKSSAWDKSCTALAGIKYPLAFADYYEKTPIDWLNEYKDRNNIYFREYDKEIRGVQTDLLLFDEGATLTYMWVDHYSNFPIRVQIDQKRDKWTVGYYEYADLVFYLDDEEVEY